MSRRYSGRQTEADSHGEGSQRTVCLALAVEPFGAVCTSVVVDSGHVADQL